LFTSLPAGIYSLKILLEGCTTFKMKDIKIPDDKSSAFIDLGKLCMTLGDYNPPLNECRTRPVVNLRSDAIEYHFCCKDLRYLPLH